MQHKPKKLKSKKRKVSGLATLLTIAFFLATVSAQQSVNHVSQADGEIPLTEVLSKTNKQARLTGEFIEISLDTLLNKVRGGLLGQIIGNLNGLPHEFKYDTVPGNVSDYIPSLPNGAFTDDDTDIEWVYINYMQANNELFLSPEQLAEIWKASFNTKIWCSNGYVRRLLDMGYTPPYTGNAIFNPWGEFNISGQFICETFGLICPAMPQSAAKLGLNYTTITISEEPAQTTQLFTTIIAMSYIENDINKLLDAGYAAIDPKSKVRLIINDIRQWHSKYPNDWRMTRKLLREKYTQANGTRRDNNGYELITGATIAAMLYGNGDFIETLQTGFNYGWDCDNVTATMGTIIGTIMGYKKMMAQGWQIVDRYKNTSRDGLPLDETITSFADRIFYNMEKMIVKNGGKRIIKDGRYYFQIQAEEPAMVRALTIIDEQVKILSDKFIMEIEKGITNPDTKENQSKAFYMAVCLNLSDKLAKKYPEEWEEAKLTFNENWKMLQLIFHGSNDNDFPSIKALQQKFIKAGINAPDKELDLVIVWQEKRMFLSPQQAMKLKVEDYPSIW